LGASGLNVIQDLASFSFWLAGADCFMKASGILFALSLPSLLELNNAAKFLLLCPASLRLVKILEKLI